RISGSGWGRKTALSNKKHPNSPGRSPRRRSPLCAVLPLHSFFPFLKNIMIYKKKRRKEKFF
ncbi:MAG: hypothetical protein LUD69_00895, partial [Oscillospiraceae bacterium]|nr:hypothetical protein [Oscillospiraceae bacterium]